MYSQSSSLHKHVLFLEHYIPKPYLHQKYFSKTMQPSHSLNYLEQPHWLRFVRELRLFHVQFTSESCNCLYLSDPALHIALIKRQQLTNPSTQASGFFVLFLIHIFNLQDEIFLNSFQLENCHINFLPT